MRRFREVVSQKLAEAKIDLYNWEVDGQVDGQVADRTNGSEIPTFTVIADKSMKERVYAWGTCNLHDREHSDFPLLKDLVMKQHLELMHQRSYDIYEELYRVPRYQREVGKGQDKGWMPPALRGLLIRSSDECKAILNGVSLAQVLCLYLTTRHVVHSCLLLLQIVYQLVDISWASMPTTTSITTTLAITTLLLCYCSYTILCPARHHAVLVCVFLLVCALGLYLECQAHGLAAQLQSDLTAEKKAVVDLTAEKDKLLNQVTQLQSDLTAEKGETKACSLF